MAHRIRPQRTTHIPMEHRFPAWGVDVFESHHADDWRMDTTRHEFLKLVFVLQGEGALARTDGTRVPCRAGDLLAVPIGQEHHLEDVEGKPMSLHVVSIQRQVLDVAALNPSWIPAGRVNLDKAGRERAETVIRRLLFEQTLDQPVAGAKVVSMALRLLAEVARAGARQESGARTRPVEVTVTSSARVHAYVEELSDHFFEATNLDRAARSLDLSRRRFTQLFREETGMSWLNYVRRLRVEHAKRLLAETERTVLSIAFECGFEDLSTFYRAFKREADMSPNQWRNGSAVDEEAQS